MNLADLHKGKWLKTMAVANFGRRQCDLHWLRSHFVALVVHMWRVSVTHTSAHRSPNIINNFHNICGKCSRDQLIGLDEKIVKWRLIRRSCIPSTYLCAHVI